MAEKKEVVWVAKYSVSEGYDIASFNTQESLLYDRFIEVKSYSGNPAFYWSRSEVDASKVKGKNYYIYLVNRDELQNSNYAPKILQNPYISVLEDADWIKEIESYFIYKL